MTTTLATNGTRGRRLPFIVTATLIALCASCSDDLVFHQVYGTVTMDGEPVKYGEMNVDPLSKRANSGRSVVCRIVDGKFDLRPTGVAGGPAEFIITVVDLGKVKIRDFENISPEEDSKIMMAKKKLFSEKVEVDQDQIDISLKSENAQQVNPRGG